MAAQGAPRVAARVPALQEKAADLAPRVELVGRSARRGLLVWWCPSWSGAADEDGFDFHVVARQGALEDGGAPRWWCNCPHGEHHPGDAACSHVRAAQLWTEAQRERQGGGR